jgi:DNA-binding GntR family transcriptional regulator
MAKRQGGESLAVDVYARLRADIFDRRFAPGERLRPTELGERFGVSVSVMREALGLLAGQSLVRIERNKGFHVAALSPKLLGDLTLARKVNEGAALRLAVARGGVTWESEVLAAHHRLTREPVYLPGEPRRRNNAWAVAHMAFHQVLIGACDNQVLLDVCARLSDAAELYRAWAGAGGEVNRDVAAEHKALMDAALAHDADDAVSLLEAHVDKTAAIVLEVVPNGDPDGRPAVSTAP